VKVKRENERKRERGEERGREKLKAFESEGEGR
jgi:hypothetical protein